MQRQVFCHLLFAENTERMDRQSDTFPRREAATQKRLGAVRRTRYMNYITQVKKTAHIGKAG